MDRPDIEPLSGVTPPGRSGLAPDAVLSVGQLNRLVAGLIERSLPLVRVAGEISNFTRAASGHWYFTLKDPLAQVRAVMFRGRAQYVGFVPREGMKVEVRALAALYEARGDFQLNVESMRQAGAGDLYQRFLQLKEALGREGLFAPERKRALPTDPRCIGIVTSPQAAALRDVLTTLARRSPQVAVIVYPTAVQGADAPAAIVAALRRAAERRECDVLLVVRGGGSIEDLWAFNDEAVARAIAAFPVPVVAGIGHETDFTIADFVADLRAATPTAAATAASPDRRDLLARLAGTARALARAGARAQQQREQRLDAATRMLRPPSAQWRERGLRMHALARRLAAAMRIEASEARHRLATGRSRLRAPATGALDAGLESVARRLTRATAAELRNRDAVLGQWSSRLEAASPQQVLARGYAIVRDGDGSIVRSAAQIRRGQSLDVMLAEGSAEVTVSATRALGDAPGV